MTAMAITPTDAPLTRHRVGFRQVIRVHQDVEATRLVDEFWHAVEEGALEIWIDVSHLRWLGSGGRCALERMNEAARELDRRFAVIAGDGPIARDLAGTSALRTYPDVSAAHRGR
jgi:hypothetical protein